MNIRRFEDKDLNDVLVLHKVAMETIGAYKGTGPWDDDLLDIPNSYKNGIFLIGEIENIVVSMGAFKHINDDTCEIKRMRTNPSYQGNGYGNEILMELIINAKLMNYKKMVLETSEKQTSAIKLYRKNDFKEFKKEIIDGFNCTWYILNLV